MLHPSCLNYKMHRCCCNVFEVYEVSHLFLTPCTRCRKAQMELCLALDRRNSAYLLENSMSPSCLLRSRPADSSCLKHNNHINMDRHIHINIRFLMHFHDLDAFYVWCFYNFIVNTTQYTVLHSKYSVYHLELCFCSPYEVTFF